MKLTGKKVVLKEEAIVIDDLGQDLLLRGTTGTVREEDGETLTLVTDKGTYTGIPSASVDVEPEDNAA